MKVKIDNIDQLNDILFYASFGCAKDSLVCVMNNKTLNKLTADFTAKYKDAFKRYGNNWYSLYSIPEWFAINNGVHFAVGNWLEDGEVDIKL